MERPELDTILAEMVRSHPRISDLNFTVGRPGQIVADGRLQPVRLKNLPDELTPLNTEEMAQCLLNHNPRLLEDLHKHGACDFSYNLPDGTRFRVNVFSQSGGQYSIVMRLLSSAVPTVEQLGLPECFKAIAREKSGIVLFTGATGTGKTTSLAAILNEINKNEAVHIITLEDPIEFIHHHEKATFNQRELGLDFDTYAHGLRSALRQAPNIILVGEMRDRETVEIALNASETGHLVFSTLHTISAGNTLNRILGFFNAEEEHQIRFRLADALRWVVGQKLLPKKDYGRIAVFEIMQNNVRVKDAILHGEREGVTFYDIIEKGRTYSMQTFDQDIIRLFDKGVIGEETGLAHASNRAKVRHGIDRIKTGRGEKTTDIEGLTLETPDPGRGGLRMR